MTSFSSPSSQFQPHTPVDEGTLKDVFGPLLVYGAALLIGGVILSGIAPQRLWDSLDQPFIAGVPLFAVLHIALGLPLYLYGSIHAPRVVRQFRAVQDADHQPTHLLQEGYYAQVRHPFYAMNMFALFGLAFSFCSPWMLVLGVLALAVFYANGLLDEAGLTVRFSGAYDDYARRVPGRYLTPATGAYLLALLVLGLLGMLF